tara:strand:- start:2049 stop:2396 length:348 start_codon:yes stop_codon:yes gene_type:complete
MAIQKDQYIKQVKFTQTGCYHRINRIQVDYETDAAPLVLPENSIAYKEKAELVISWQTFLNSGERYAEDAHLDILDHKSCEAPISILSGVTDKSSLLASAYSFLKTGDICSGIDV